LKQRKIISVQISDQRSARGRARMVQLTHDNGQIERIKTKGSLSVAGKPEVLTAGFGWIEFVGGKSILRAYSNGRLNETLLLGTPTCIAYVKGADQTERYYIGSTMGLLLVNSTEPTKYQHLGSTHITTIQTHDKDIRWLDISGKLGQISQ